MPKKVGKVPSYCRHRASNRAVVRIAERPLPRQYGSPESHEEYERLIAEWRVRQAEELRTANTPDASISNSLTINALILAYLEFAKGYYIKTGSPLKSILT